jgi:hypothetical protein
MTMVSDERLARTHKKKKKKKEEGKLSGIEPHRLGGRKLVRNRTTRILRDSPFQGRGRDLVGRERERVSMHERAQF